MNRTEYSLDDWLQGQLSDPDDLAQDIWDPGFDPERRVVVAKLGSYRKLYQRPANYQKRFFHKIYPLTIETWQLQDQIKLYDGFCTIDADLEIRFQATLKYVQANSEILPEINPHIKAGYEGLVRDVLDKELLELNDGAWIQTGLAGVERRIETGINETLIVKNIQCRTLCALKPTFEQLPDEDGIDGRFVQEPIYLSVLKKNFEFREKQSQELFREEQEKEREKLEHQRKLLEQLNEEEEIKRQKQSAQAENIKRLLEEQEQQQAEQHDLENRLHSEKIEHQYRLQEIEQQTRLEEQQKQLLRDQEMELQQEKQKREQQALLKEKEVDDEIRQFEEQQLKWNEAKQRLQEQQLIQEELIKQKELESELKTREVRQVELQKVEEQLQRDKIDHEKRMKELRLESDVREHEERFATIQKTDEFLRREIEMLVLEKQRAELSQEVKKAESGK